MNPAPEYLYSITKAGVVEKKCPISARDTSTTFRCRVNFI